MGLFNQGTPLDWPGICQHKNKAKMDGIEQFLNVYHSAKNFREHDLKWGDEIEYMLLKFEPLSRKVRLSLTAHHILDELQKEENAQTQATLSMLWRPEFAKWMVEGTPGVPYRYYVADLVNVERNMMLRRKRISELLGKNETVMTLTTFPRMGCESFTSPVTEVYDQQDGSYFISDKVCHPNPKFLTIVQHIRLRRGSKVCIQLPLFMDESTKETQPFIPNESNQQVLLKNCNRKVFDKGIAKKVSHTTVGEGFDTPLKQSLVMNNSIFGPGCCCLQVTIQGRDISESRYLYDQLAIMAPLMLALTAATPAIHGSLVDTDTRWSILCPSLDDRNPIEVSSGLLPKSRCSSIDCFLSDLAQCKADIYNDIPIAIHNEAYNKLIADGVDHLLAQHIAHLFVRDPLLLYKEELDKDNSRSMFHFDNILSTNWNTVRFKLPPPDTDIGWRTEFRPMEVGLTDFENAALSVFVVILSRVILAFNLDLYIPISKVDKNMEVACKRDAVRSERFFFKKKIFNSSDGSKFLCGCGQIHDASVIGGQKECQDMDMKRFVERNSRSDLSCDSMSDTYELMTIDEIFNGRLSISNESRGVFDFPGLVPLMRGYVEALKVDGVTRGKVLRYIDFVSERASGKLMTNASYIREFIRSHKAYNMNSVISEEICHDLVKHLQDITNGTVQAPRLLGNFYHESLGVEVETPLSMVELMRKKWEGNQAGLLLGATMPKSVLWDTMVSIAKYKNQRQCGY